MTVPGTLQQPLPDPLLREVDLPIRATYHPLGFPVTLSSNSHDVHKAALESWGSERPAFETPAIELHVAVREEGALATEPSYRSQAHLLSIVSCPNNFAVLDLRALFAYAYISSRTAADRTWFRFFFLEPMALVLLTQSAATPVHAACVARAGKGVLLCGASGAGKSTLAYACARSGWTYVSDDAAWLLRSPGQPEAIGTPHRLRLRPDAPALFPELSGSIPRARPNGKLSIEVCTAGIPKIATATRTTVGAVAFLQRDRNTAPAVEPLNPAEVWKELAGDGAYATYGEETDRRHDQERRRLLRVPGYRLHYSQWQDAVELLCAVI